MFSRTAKLQYDSAKSTDYYGQRFGFIDTAKGIGILLVVIAHVNYSHPLLTIIYSFHMPLFFVLSGILFKPQSYGSFIGFLKRKIQTLICPYVLFYLLSIIYCVVVQLAADYNNFNWELYFEYFLQMFISQGSANVVNAPLWFVPCLMLVETIYYFISKANKCITAIVSVLLTGIGWLFESGLLGFNNTLLPWSMDSAMFAVGFFALGNLAKDCAPKFATYVKSDRYGAIKCIGIILACIGLLIPLALINGKVSLGSKILNNGFLLYATGIIGSLCVLSLGVLLEKVKILTYCGKNSFYIMSVHYLAKDAIRMFCKFADIPMYDKTNFAETIIPIIIVLCLSLSFVSIYNRIKSVILNKGIKSTKES